MSARSAPAYWAPAARPALPGVPLPRTALLAALLGALLLSACAHVPRRAIPAGPLPPPPPANPAAVPDAVPRAEPRSASGNPPFYDVAGHRYVVLASAAGYRERGVASWYGPDFHGLRTATGERYDMFAMTAAHKTLPIPCYARVTNLSNGRSTVVRINDRGPFVANRIIDLSYSAALKLDMIRNGTAFVEVDALTPAAPPLPAALPATTAAASAAGVGVSTVPAMTAPLAPAPFSAAAPSHAPAMTDTNRFYIQVGAYGRAENARRAAQRLRDDGLEHVFTLEAAADQPLRRVRIGPISSVQEFDQLIARLSALGFAGARLAQD
ncbi:MAG TPA: septal ring lytic transglycosylase RlpA family protein [Steroidobacteraceae bacterium]